MCRFLKNLKTLQSPVFLSTGQDGRVVEGCGGIPLNRPLLLVSNHQTFALDIGPLVEGLLRQTGLLPRGLTHPAVFQVCTRLAHLYNLCFDPNRETRHYELSLGMDAWLSCEACLCCAEL